MLRKGISNWRPWRTCLRAQLADCSLWPDALSASGRANPSHVGLALPADAHRAAVRHHLATPSIRRTRLLDGSNASVAPLPQLAPPKRLKNSYSHESSRWGSMSFLEPCPPRRSIPPMTLSNMQELGLQSLAMTCEVCHRAAGLPQTIRPARADGVKVGRRTDIDLRSHGTSDAASGAA